MQKIEYDGLLRMSYPKYPNIGYKIHILGYHFQVMIYLDNTIS